jgi:electron transfer flavoprotein alpha subunit
MSFVLVVVEDRNGAVTRASLEAIAAGQHLAAQLGLDCSAAVLGESIAPLLEALQTKQLARVFALEHPLLKLYTADAYIAALEQLIRQTAPAYVLFPHTYQVRDFAPALATRFQQVLISDVIAIHAAADQPPTFVRQLFQGKLNADYRPSRPPSAQAPCFVSIQAGSFSVEALVAGFAPVEPFEIDLSPAQIRTTPSAPFREASHAVDLTAAPVIVSVGRGIREQENLALVQALADILGAELAASRPICDTRLRDSFGRAITDLRISVTDRCNYKCVYCRTGNEGAQYTELPIADYLRMVRILVSLGIEKVRLTGGEPLLRSGLVEMVAELAQLRTAYHPDGTRSPRAKQARRSTSRSPPTAICWNRSPRR